MSKPIILNIGGEKGNAFYIMSTVDKLVKAGFCAYPNKTSKDVLDEMKRGDYDDLLRAYVDNFPMVTLFSNRKLPGVDATLYKVADPNFVEL